MNPPPFERFLQKSSPLQRTLVGWLIFVLLIVVIEVFGFNYQSWITRDLQPTTIVSGMDLSSADEAVVLDLDEPMAISTLDILTKDSCELTVYLSDEGRDNWYHFEVGVDPSTSASRVFPIAPYGMVKDIALKLDTLGGIVGPTSADDEGAISTYIYSVQANVPIPFVFSPIRVTILLLCGLIIWGFCTKRRLFRMPSCVATGEKLTVASKIATALCACLVCVSFATSSLVNYQELGTFTTDGETGALEHTEPVRYYGEYADLAESLAAGQLSLLDEPPQWMSELENPYDVTQRAGHEGGYRWDTAYFDGQYYVYFGVLPAILFHLPFFLITGQALPTFIPCLLCTMLALIGICILIALIAKRYVPTASVGTVVLCQLLASTSCFLMWCTRLPNLYMLPVACALMFLVWGAICYLSLYRKPWLAIPGSFALAAIFGCRPQIGIFCLLLIPFGIQALRHLPERKTRSANNAQNTADVGEAVSAVSQQTTTQANAKRLQVLYLVGALLPFVIVLSLLGVYNFLRFGSPFDFGANYNLTTNDMTRRPYSLSMALDALFYYFMQPPAFAPSMPFFTNTELLLDHNGMLISEPMLGGILWLSPVIWFALSLWRTPRMRLYLIGAVILAIIVAAFDGLMAGILPRYQMDFALPLVLLGAVGLLQVAPRYEQCTACTQPKGSWSVRCGKACLFVALASCVGILFYIHSDVVAAKIHTWELIEQMKILLF